MYDLKVLDELLSTVEGSEFYDPPQGPFYRRDLGLQSGYGDLVGCAHSPAWRGWHVDHGGASLQNANMLKFLSSHDGKWDAEKYATGLMMDFGPGSDYDQFGQLEHGIDK